jgi:hypothetical protein
VSILCALISLAVLYFILKYRVHINIEITSSRGPRPRVKAGNVSSIHPSRKSQGTESHGASLARRRTGEDPSLEITSALVNLGSSKAEARAAAKRAIAKLPDAPFDVVLRAAIQEAA